MKVHMKSIASLMLLCAMLAACGGGGGSTTDTANNSNSSGNQTSETSSSNTSGSSESNATSTTGNVAPVQSSMEGLYVGTTADGGFYKSVVLSNQTYWALYGLETNGAVYMQGLVNGINAVKTLTSYTVKGSNISSVGRFDAAELSANYVAGVGMNGAVTTPLKKIGFIATPLKTSQYDYNSRSRVSDVTGQWSADTLENKKGDWFVSTTGAITANLAGCLVSGQMTPSDSGKNMFKVVIRTGVAPCTVPLTQFSGDAVKYGTATGFELMVFTTNEAGTKAMALLARQ